VNRPAIGVSAVVDGEPVGVGRPSLFDTVPAPVSEAALAAEDLGRTVVFAGRGASPKG
jgi:cation transport ATPase